MLKQFASYLNGFVIDDKRTQMCLNVVKKIASMETSWQQACRFLKNIIPIEFMEIKHNCSQ